MNQLPSTFIQNAQMPLREDCLYIAVMNRKIQDGPALTRGKDEPVRERHYIPNALGPNTFEFMMRGFARQNDLWVVHADAEFAVIECPGDQKAASNIMAQIQQEFGRRYFEYSLVDHEVAQTHLDLINAADGYDDRRFADPGTAPLRLVLDS